MSFSIRTIIRALLAPKHKLLCSRELWSSITRELDRRGNQQHEAGAFLLGRQIDKRRVILAAVFYDELDAHAYDSGVCILEGPSFSKLWAVCRQRKLTVVADVHTHEGLAIQSESDRTNPMIARAGHIAIIFPRFAREPVRLRNVGIYEYLGNHDWIDHSAKLLKCYVYVGRWS